MSAESLFPRDETDDVELTVSIKGLLFVFTHANTELYTYRRFPEVNHVYHQYYEEHAEKQIAIFDSQDLVDQLRELNFGERVLPRPTDWDEKAFMQFHSEKLERELDEL